MGRSLDQLMGLPVDEMTDEEIDIAIKFHREQLLGRVGTPNIYVRLADLERVAKERRLEGVAKERRLEGVPQGYQIAIALYDPHMKKLDGEVVSYISSTTAKERLRQASDALMNRNWLVMNDRSIKASFEEITESAFPPTPEDIEEIHDKLERAIDAGGVLDHVKEVRDLVIQSYIDKKYVEKMDQVIP